MLVGKKSNIKKKSILIFSNPTHLIQKYLLPGKLHFSDAGKYVLHKMFWDRVTYWNLRVESILGYANQSQNIISKNKAIIIFCF